MAIYRILSRISALLGLMFLLVISHSAMAADLLLDDQTFKLTATLPTHHSIALHWTIKDHAYLYKKFINVTAQSPSNIAIGTITFPEGEIDSSLVFGKMIIYKKQLSLIIPIKNVMHPNTPVKLTVSYQGCSDNGHCFPPASHVMAVNFQTQTVQMDNRPMATGYSAQKIEQDLANHTIFWLIGMFLLFGLLLAFTPCVLPMIPILSSIIIRDHTHASKKTALFLSLAYVLGMSLAYALLGLVISLIGSGIQGFLQNPYVIIVFGLLFVILALSLFGLFEVKLPNVLSNKLLNASNKFSHGSYIGVVIMGFLSALIVSPCVAPPLVGALTYIATTGNILVGTLALFSLGFGMGIPLIIIGVLGTKVLPKSGQWMNVVKFILGFLLLAIAVMLWQRVVSARVDRLLWGLFAIVIGVITFFAMTCTTRSLRYLKNTLCLLGCLYGILLIYGGIRGNINYLNPLVKPQSVVAPYVTVTDLTTLVRQLKTAKRLKKPVLIDFYADWCLDCKTMDIRVFQKRAVKKALRRFIWIKVDVTKSTPETLAIEKRYGVFGPPAFIFYSADNTQRISLNFVGMKSAADVLHLLGQI